MTEQEKAIEAIKNDLEWHKKELKPMYREYLRMAIEALEKQIPKKPKLFVGASRYKICPTCHLVLSEVQRKLELPCKCGQKLLWEDEE